MKEIKNIKNQDKESSREELVNKIKAVEVNKQDGLVFFGTCHCWSTGTTS